MFLGRCLAKVFSMRLSLRLHKTHLLAKRLVFVGTSSNSPLVQCMLNPRHGFFQVLLAQASSAAFIVNCLSLAFWNPLV